MTEPTPDDLARAWAAARPPHSLADGFDGFDGTDLEAAFRAGWAAALGRAAEVADGWVGVATADKGLTGPFVAEWIAADIRELAG